MGIKLKQGKCSECKDDIPKPVVGQREKALCVTHYQAAQRRKSVPIAKKSKKRERQEEKYRRARDKYFEEHPVCEFPGCTSRKITLHHKRGRVGAFLTDKRWFCSLCDEHHKFVEQNPDEAKRLQLSLSRLDKFAPEIVFENIKVFTKFKS